MSTAPVIIPPRQAGRILRLSVDVTETVTKQEWTGIGRVARRITAELMAAAPQGGPEIRPVVAVDGRFHQLTDAGLHRLAARDPAFSGVGSGGVAQLIVRLLGFAPPLYAAVHARMKQRKLRTLLTSLTVSEPAECGPADVIVLLDAFWGGMSSIAAARRAREQGASVVTVVYDLIPISHPQYMARHVALTFARQMTKAIRLSDGALTISRATKQQLAAFLGDRRRPFPIRWFHLGNDASGTASARAAPAESFHYAMIGTIEPRKGHDVVLDAFERRWAAGSQCVLTIVGKMGWASPDFRRRLDDHAEAGFRLIVLTDVSDAQLAKVLSDSDALIQASTVEGFGLPIVEALAHDTPVIASDIPVFREVGGESIIYFTPRDADALLAAMTTFEHDPTEYLRRAKAFEWPTWRDAARRFREAIEDIVAAKKG